MFRYCLIIFCLAANLSFAQTNYISKVYNVENGLPSNGIKGIEWDEATGFLWIATEAGIVRYDGINFKTFSQQNTPFIQSERMSFITRSNSGAIYIADFPKNIIAVNKNNLELRIKADTFAANPGNGSYLVTVSEKFYKLKKNNNHPMLNTGVYTPVIPLSETSCLLINNRRLFYFSSSLHAPELLKAHITNVFKIEDQCYITDDDNQLFLLDTNHSLIKQESAFLTDEDKILQHAIIKWQNGMSNPLVFKDGKVWLMLKEHSKISLKLLMSGFPKDLFIRSAQYSPSYNILFIATDSKGLLFFYPQKVFPKKASHPNDENRNAYYSQIDLGNGNILTNEGDVIGDSKESPKIPITGKINFFTYLSDDSILWY